MSAVARPDLFALQRRFLAAQLAGDRRTASAVIVEGLEGGVSALDLHEVVLRGAQQEIGRLWQENVVTVAQKHITTTIANLVLSQLFEHAVPAPPNGKKIIVACVDGETHELPARLVADALELAGFEVRYLGANVPTPSLVSLVEAERPALVALSVTLGFHLPALREAVAAIRAVPGPAPLLAVGGGAAPPELARKLGADVTASSGVELAQEALRRLGVGGR